MVMGRLTLFLIGIVLSLSTFSQGRFYVLHPLVGDTIDKNEKFNYILFGNIEDSKFNYCTLTHTKDAYFINLFSPDNTGSTIEVDSAELKQYIVQLDKVMEFNANEGKVDTTKKDNLHNGNLNDLHSKGLENSLINEHSKDRILKEVRTQTRMNEDAQRYEQGKNGTDLFAGSGRVEFPVIKGKKRKKK